MVFWNWNKDAFKWDRSKRWRMSFFSPSSEQFPRQSIDNVIADSNCVCRFLLVPLSFRTLIISMFRWKYAHFFSFYQNASFKIWKACTMKFSESSEFLLCDLFTLKNIRLVFVQSPFLLVFFMKLKWFLYYRIWKIQQNKFRANKYKSAVNILFGFGFEFTMIRKVHLDWVWVLARNIWMSLSQIQQCT